MLIVSGKTNRPHYVVVIKVDVAKAMLALDKLMRANGTSFYV